VRPPGLLDASVAAERLHQLPRLRGAAVGAAGAAEPAAESAAGDSRSATRRSDLVRAGYAPIYTGSHYDSYYDRYDTRSFDSNMASSGPSTASWGDDVKGGTGVGDS
jgi:hypothetical protein